MAKERPQNRNLNPFTADQSREQAKINGRKGGIASGEAKRRKASMRELARQIASAPVTSDKTRTQLERFGIDDESMTNDAMVVAGVFQQAVKGDVKAIEKWQELTEVGKDDDQLYELPARVIGKAFVDINRNFEPNKTYIFRGGRGGLKSSYVSLKIIELLKNNPLVHACVVRKVGATLKDSVFAQLKWAIHELGLDDEFRTKTNPLEITLIKTGQTIYFRGCDDPLKLKSIKPTFGYIGILWKEERDQIAGADEERSINQSVLRGGNLSWDISSYNPPKSSSNWVNQELKIEDPNRVVHTSSYLDAPPEWLGRKFLDDAEHLKEVNPSAYEHEYLGIANGAGGNVFEGVEIREITDEEIGTFDRIYQGVDWGWYPDIYAFVRVAYNSAKETLYIIAEHTGNKMANSETAQWIKENGYDDYRITCDSAEPKSVNDYKDLGLPAVPAIKGAGSIEYSFKWLAVRHIVIDPKRCPVSAKEFIEYEYQRDKNGDVISGYPDANNHTIDAVRYATESYWTRRGNQA